MGIVETLANAYKDGKAVVTGLQETHADKIATAKGAVKVAKVGEAALSGNWGRVGTAIESAASGSEAVVAPLNAVPVIGNILAEGEQVIAGGVFMVGGGVTATGLALHGHGKEAAAKLVGTAVGAGTAIVPGMGVADLANAGAELTTHHSVNHGATIPVTVEQEVTARVLKRMGGTVVSGGDDVQVLAGPSKTPANPAAHYSGGIRTKG